LFGTLTSNRYECDGIIKIICEVEGIRDYRGLSKAKRRDFVNNILSSFPGIALSDWN
jgi:hypothetical protein